MKKTISKRAKKKTLQETLSEMSGDDQRLLKSCYISDEVIRSKFKNELKEIYEALNAKTSELLCVESDDYKGKFIFDNHSSQIIWQFVRLSQAYNYMITERDSEDIPVFSTASSFGLEIESYSSSNLFLPKDDYARFSMQVYFKTDNIVKDVKSLFELLRHFDSIVKFTNNKSLFFFHPFLSITTKREIFNSEYLNRESKDSVMNHALLLDINTLIKMIAFIYLCPKQYAFEGSVLKNDLVEWTYAYREITNHIRGDFQQKEYIDHIVNAVEMIRLSPFCFFNLAVEKKFKRKSTP